VKYRSRSGRLTSVSDDEKSATILQPFIEMPNTATKKIATENDLSQPIICV